MEALLFALIIVRNAYRSQGAFGPEPEKFQSFDLQALRHLYNAKDKSQSRPSDRQKSYVAQSVS
jgi:hypothetical protein